MDNFAELQEAVSNFNGPVGYVAGAYVIQLNSELKVSVLRDTERYCDYDYKIEILTGNDNIWEDISEHFSESVLRTLYEKISAHKVDYDKSERKKAINEKIGQYL